MTLRTEDVLPTLAARFHGHCDDLIHESGVFIAQRLAKQCLDALLLTLLIRLCFRGNPHQLLRSFFWADVLACDIRGNGLPFSAVLTNMQMKVVTHKSFLFKIMPYF